MKRIMWIAGVLALVGAAVAAPPTGAAAGGNSANAKLCQKDGWKTLYRGDGSTFANQGDCVSYGAHGKTILEPSKRMEGHLRTGRGGVLDLEYVHRRGNAPSARVVRVRVHACVRLQPLPCWLRSARRTRTS